MSIRGRAGAAFVRLPTSIQLATLHRLGKRAPWEPGFDHRAPAAESHLLVGPPDFVGVGVQKAGTTWWYRLIAEHPGVYHHSPFHKERHFFGRFSITEFSDMDANEYHKWFPRPVSRITGEWTPDYVHQHWVAPLLRAAAPDVKLLVVLRDPVERFRSGLDHCLQRGERLTPVVVSDAFSRGLYGSQLARLEGVFPRDRILVLQYEACVADTRARLADTFAFLEIDDSFIPDELDRRVSHTGRPVKLPDTTRHQLIELYRDDLRLLAISRPELDFDLWPTLGGKASQLSGL